MKNKLNLQTYEQMAAEAEQKILKSPENWQDFLRFAARFYKYSYLEQLQIYAQRPEATACADVDTWNQRMGRHIVKEENGIGTISQDFQGGKLRYLFDVSDTEGKPFPPVWTLLPEQEAPVIDFLQDYFNVTGDTTEEVVSNAAETILQESLDIFAGADYNSFKELKLNREFLKKSVAAISLLRCGKDTLEFQQEILPTTESSGTISLLGQQINEASRILLRQIEKTVKAINRERSEKYEHNGLQENEAQREERAGLREERGLLDSGDHDSGARDRPGTEPLGTGPHDIPERETPVGVRNPSDPCEAVLPLPGAGTAGGGTVRHPHGAADERSRGDGEPESQRPHEVGWADEQLQGTGGRDHLQRNDLRLTGFSMDGDQLSLFPTEESQSEVIKHRELDVKASGSFSISADEFDNILRRGSLAGGSAQRIYKEISSDSSLPELVQFLKKEYGTGGLSYTFSNGKTGFVDFSVKGISVSGKPGERTVFSWNTVAKRLRNLVAEEKYLPPEADELEMDIKEGDPSPWGNVQTSRKIADGVYEISTASHGGILVHKSVEKTLLSEEAGKIGFLENGWHGYEEDAEACIPIRELIDRGIFEIPSHYSGTKEEYIAMIDDSIRYWFPEYWETRTARLEASSHAAPEDIAAALLPEDTFVPNSWSVHEAHRAYLALKQEHPDNLILVQVGNFFELYQEDAKTASELLDLTLTRTAELEMIGRVPMAGFPSHVLEEYTEKLRTKHGVTILAYDRESRGMKPLSFSSFAEKEAPERDYSFEYQLLDRLRSDCEYFLGAGGRHEKCLWAGTVSEQIAKMREMYNLLPEKPEWLTEEKIDSYAQQMKPRYQVVVYHHFENGFDEMPEYQTLQEAEKVAQSYVDGTMPNLYGDSFQYDGAAVYDLQKKQWVCIIGNFPLEHASAQQNSLSEQAEVVAAPSEKQFVATNYHITDDDLGTGTLSQKYTRNVAAIQLLKSLEETGRPATPTEQEVLSRYVGWGGLADVFDERNSRYQQTKDLLTESEYVSARASTLNAHYTTPVVIRAIYSALENMGFRTGKILEPSCGVGNFFGCLPETMQGSELYGVELDGITGRIAKYLYPDANITVAGFETTDRRDFFDVAVGNVPFGQYQVNDPAYNKLGFSIHDYFFAKTLDQVRPGGIIAFITSRYTMDKQSPKVRQYIAQRAELLGAIRLPNNAFKANAGTEVVSDIIFLQKRERPIEIEPDWVRLGQTADGFTINSYFIDHPEMMLGTPTSESTQYGRRDFTLIPIAGADLGEQFQEAIQNIHGVYREADVDLLPTSPTNGQEVQKAEAPAWLDADPNVRRYSYTVVDGTVYYREDDQMVRVDTNNTAAERVKGMIALRDTARALITAQMENAPDEPVQALQAELDRRYDEFRNKFGLLNDRVNARAFEKDDSYYLLCSLEVFDDDGNFQRKSDIFTRRTIKPHTAVASVDTAAEALAVSISEKACVDLGYMASLMGGSDKIPHIVEDLQGVIFKDPATGPFDLESKGTHWSQGWQTADEYLSGNIRKKMAVAKDAAEKDSFFAPYVDSLQTVLPKDLDASEISVSLGAAWIDPEYVQQFMYETFQTPSWQQDKVKVEYSPHTAEWYISTKSYAALTEVLIYSTYGTKRANAYEILEDTLNLRNVEIYDIKKEDGKEKRVLNGKETILAQQKQQAIKDAFQDWLWQDPKRRRTLVRKYNDTFNSTRPREYDGSHIVFHGMNPEITLREHQLNAVAHILYGDNVLLAHKVGAGKTFEMVAAAMESKRLGLCQKPLFVVPNHIIGQWATEFYRLYPSANVLVTTEKDFEKANRKKFCARIATGDYDAVIMGHSQFTRLPISSERQINLISDQIKEIEDGIKEMREIDGRHHSVKQLERTKRNLQIRSEKLLEAPKRDDVVTFEELGVDRLFVDEAHNFKNLFFYTKMSNVAGLSTAEAQKSSDMLAKCRYMDEITGGRGIVFATGTPVSNSMVEIYTMQRYLQWDALETYGWSHFDCWAAQFGDTQTAIELAPEGTGYRARRRFSRFKNLPELMNVFREVADIKTEEDLHLPTPEVEFHTIVAQPTAHQKFLVQELSKRAEAVHNRVVEPTEDNMLKITSDGRKLGLDQRLINPDFPDDSGSKVNQCVNLLFQTWQKTAEEKLTQLVFCDFSTPKGDGSFNLYDDIRDKLTARGIPLEEIAYIHSAKTTAQKQNLFAKVRSGRVRILMGSTQKMGAGTDVQDRLIALHDLDCPWKPGDLEQRLGRIARQGNQNSKVRIYRYVTDGTFDAYLWQTVEIKQRFISQIMTSKAPLRVYEDNDATALSYAEIKALCAGNPLIKEKMDLDISVSKLKLLKADFEKKRHSMEDDLCINVPQRIAQYEQSVKNYQEDLKVLAESPLPADGFIGMEISGRLYTEKETAGQAILDRCKCCVEETQIGTYRGFDCSLKIEGFGRDHILTLHRHGSYRVELGESALGNITRIENTLNKLPDLISATQERLKTEKHQLELLRVESVKPFPQEDELREKTDRLIELNAQLNMDNKEHQDAAPEQHVQG